MSGQTISHYPILKKLGEDSMRLEYKTHDTKLGRQVALKFFPAGIIEHADDISRFRGVSLLCSRGNVNVY